MGLTIRQAERVDAVAIKQIYEQPHVINGTLQIPYPSAELWENRHDKADDLYHSLLAELDGKVVGQLGLQTFIKPRRKHVAAFGLAVCASVLGSGVASKLVSAALDLCDNWLNIERVELEVYTDNHAAIGLYKKFNFEIEGEHRNYAFRNGEYVNSYSMSRLKSKLNK